jgi:hypothetical protein
MVPSCAAWLRLLVTALLCVTGVARPIAQRSDAANSVRAQEPMHVSAPGRDTEVSRLGRRTADDPSGDTPGINDAFVDRVVVDSLLVDMRDPLAARPASASHDMSRARGPPMA